MSWLLDRIARSSRRATLALVFLVVPTTLVHAQFFGGYGYGYGVPAYGYGYGYPGYGLGGFGYPGLAYGPGFGYPGYGYGYGYGASFYYGGPGISVGGPGPYGFVPVGGPGPGIYNPYFGVGLTPLGVESALTERYLLGRGTTGYSSGYGTSPPAGYVAPGTGVIRP